MVGFSFEQLYPDASAFWSIPIHGTGGGIEIATMQERLLILEDGYDFNFDQSMIKISLKTVSLYSFLREGSEAKDSDFYF